MPNASPRLKEKLNKRESNNQLDTIEITCSVIWLIDWLINWLYSVNAAPAIFRSYNRRVIWNIWMYDGVLIF